MLAFVTMRNNLKENVFILAHDFRGFISCSWIYRKKQRPWQQEPMAEVPTCETGNSGRERMPGLLSLPVLFSLVIFETESYVAQAGF